MTNRRKILIVEDDADTRQGLEIMLQQSFETVTAEDGISAVSIARREQPHAIVLDVGLPGCSGIELLDRLKDIDDLAFTPTVVLTGQGSDRVDLDAFDAGAAVVLRKPADHRELIEVLESLAQEADTDRRRVLVIEDDPDARQGLSIQLRARNHVVYSAGDAATGLSMACKVQPDLVLLDLGLPCGSGLDVLKRLRALEACREIPVIVVSGTCSKVDFQDAIQSGADGFFPKPPNPAALMEAIEEAL